MQMHKPYKNCIHVHIVETRISGEKVQGMSTVQCEMKKFSIEISKHMKTHTLLEYLIFQNDVGIVGCNYLGG